MIQIDLKMPKCCAECPLMVRIPEVGLKPTWMCRVSWKEIKTDSIFEKRAKFCTIRKVKGRHASEK